MVIVIDEGETQVNYGQQIIFFFLFEIHTKWYFFKIITKNNF